MRLLNYFFVLFCRLVLASSSASALATPPTSSTAKTKQPYAVNLRVAVKQERRQEFLDLIRDNQVKTLEDEPDSLQYVVGEDTSTPNLFYLHEQFTSPQGFEDHRTTAHNANWVVFKNSDPFEEGYPILDFYHVEDAVKLNKEPILPSKTYCVQVELYVKPDQREAFLECIQNNHRGSNAEPLCYQYVYGESTSEANKFVFHEEYKGKEGFEAHSKAPHFAVWEDFAATGPFTKDPVVNFFETI